MFGGRMAFVVGALVAMALGGASFSAAGSAGPGSEPGPVTVETEADYWGSYKIVRVEVTHHRADKPPISTEAWVDADRHPSSDGLEIESDSPVGGPFLDVWREDAPLVFKALDTVCPRLKNVC